MYIASIETFAKLTLVLYNRRFRQSRCRRKISHWKRSSHVYHHPLENRERRTRRISRTAVREYALAKSSRQLSHRIDDFYEVDWDEHAMNEPRLQWLQQFNDTQYLSRGAMTLDDVLLEKSGKHIPDSGTFWDHSEDR